MRLPVVPPHASALLLTPAVKVVTTPQIALAVAGVLAALAMPFEPCRVT